MSNEWFRHDYNAHEDIKQKRLIKRHGLSALGMYWYLVELLYQNNGRMDDKDVRLEAELMDGLDYLDSFIEFEMFTVEDGVWTCRRIVDELSYREEQRQRKSEAGKKGMASRWGYNTDITKDNTVITDNNKTPKSITEDNTLTFTLTDNKERVELSKDNSPRKKVFQKPTLSEVEAYCKERGNNIDAQAWFDYYDSVDWFIGNKKRMSDWKASIRTWEHNEREKASTPTLPFNKKQFRPTDITGQYKDIKSEVIEI